MVSVKVMTCENLRIFDLPSLDIGQVGSGMDLGIDGYLVFGCLGVDRGFAFKANKENARFL